MAKTLEEILDARDVRNELQSNINLMTGLVIPTSLQQFNSFTNNINPTGFYFGKSIWGIDSFGVAKSGLASKYGI